jgi:hypothetical protein
MPLAYAKLTVLEGCGHAKRSWRGGRQLLSTDGKVALGVKEPWRVRNYTPIPRENLLSKKVGMKNAPERVGFFCVVF